MHRFILSLFLLLVMVPSLLGQEDTEDPIPGKIAYIGVDHNVYVLEMKGDLEFALTDDADSLRRYQWPTWSTDNKLAFFCCDVAFSGLPRTDVYVSVDGESEADLVFSADGQVFTYANWAPADCELGAGCRDLGVLLGGAGSFDVQLIRNHDEISNTLIGSGAPFYFSWSPLADRLLTQRNDRRFDIYDLTAGEMQPLLPQPGFMQAPSWSPTDERLLYGALSAVGNRTDLIIQEGDSQQVLVESLPGRVAMNWSPDSRFVAYRTITDKFSDLIVLDAQTGQRVLETSVGGVIAFFWSPDSSRLALVSFETQPGAFSISTAAQQQGPLSLAWWAIDVATGETRRYASFVPTSEMVYIFNFFDQFAQSHSLWSPDSRMIVFSEILPDGVASINLLDMTRADAVPFAVAEGVIGIWSYR